MKNNLGKIFLLLFLSLNLLASSYEWSVEVDKKIAMTNEPIHLVYTCRFSDVAQTYTIEFNPVVDNEELKVLLLSEDESIVDAKRVNTYEFVLYVKKPQNLELFFDTTMKKTNKDSIQNSVLGRDNAEYEDYNIRVIRQKSIKVEIIDAKSNLVGELKKEIQKDEKSINSYEPYHLEFKIKGRANFDAIKMIDFEIDEVKVIKEQPVKNTELTKDGEVGLWSQKFAFIAKEDFSIPATEIEYFDLESKKLTKLSFEKIDIEVKPLYKKEELLDKQENAFKFKSEYIYYFLTFITGFLVAKIKFKKRVKLSSKEKSFNQKIDNAKSLDELMMVLVLQDAKKYTKTIETIEKKEIKSLKNVKKMCKFNYS